MKTDSIALSDCILFKSKRQSIKFFKNYLKKWSADYLL